MISFKYGCASPEQNGGKTPRNLLSSDDERVPVGLIRVAFMKKSVMRSPISELLFLISTSVATNINFQILKATFWHTIGQLFGNFVAQCGLPSCGIYSGDYESYNLVPRVISYSSLPGWPGAWFLSLHNRIGSLSNENGDGNEERQKKGIGSTSFPGSLWQNPGNEVALGLDWQNNNFARFFVSFFAVVARLTTWKCLMSRFMRTWTQDSNFLFLFLNFNTVH